MGVTESIKKVLKPSRRDLDDIPGRNSFWHAMSGEFLAEAINGGADCGGLEKYE